MPGTSPGMTECVTSLTQRVGNLGIRRRLVHLGEFHDHQRRRPIVPQSTLSLRERHRHRRPSLERAGLERLDHRLRLGGLGGLDRVRKDDRIGESRSEEHTSELQSQFHLVCRLLLEKKKNKPQIPSASKTKIHRKSIHSKRKES